jgi:hypothetical protein
VVVSRGAANKVAASEVAVNRVAVKAVVSRLAVSKAIKRTSKAVVDKANAKPSKNGNGAGSESRLAFPYFIFRYRGS